MIQCLKWGLLGLLLLGAVSRDTAHGMQKQSPQEADDFLFDIQPRVIAAGEAALLRWSIKGATKVTLEEATESSRELRTLGSYGGSGSLQVRPKENTSYIISCEGSTQHVCASVSIRVQVKRR